jgi:hypothetical protein
MFENLDWMAILRDKKRHEGYVLSVDHAADMAVHIYAEKPYKLLNRVRPREDPAIKEYRLLSYEPVTTATSDKAMVTVQKIMNPKLYTIKFPESGKELEQYLFENYPYYRDMMVYINDVLIRGMIGDPNSVAIVMPLDMMITDSEKAQPIIDIAKSSQVWDYEFGKWYLIHRKEEKKGKETFNWFHYIDKTSIIYFKTTSRDSKDITITELARYEHGIGEPPVWFLGGIITKMSYNGALYRSFFSAAIPHWNKAVTGDSDLDGAYVNHMHPIRVEVTEDCGFMFQEMRCNGGKINLQDGKSVDCPSCFGTGRKSVKSPYGVYQVTKPGLGETAAPIAPVSYVSVPTEPTRMLEERVQKQLDKGLAAINMFFEVGENQSGIAKVLDRSELYDFLLTMSTVVFDVHITNIIYYTASYLYMNKVEGKIPEIQKPTSFDLLTPQEEAVVLSAAQAAGLDNTYIRVKMANMIQKDLYGKPTEMNIALDALKFNTLSGYTPDEVITLQTGGLIEEITAVIYANINGIIQDLYAQYPDFYSFTYEKKEELINAEAEEIMSMSETIVPTTKHKTTVV